MGKGVVASRKQAHHDQTSLTVCLKSPKGLKSVCCGFFSQPWNGFLHQPEKVMLLGVGFCTRRPVLWQHQTSMSWDETKKVSSNHTERDGIWNLRPGSNRSWLCVCLRKSSHSLWLNFYIFLSLITGRVGEIIEFPLLTLKNSLLRKTRLWHFIKWSPDTLFIPYFWVSPLRIKNWFSIWRQIESEHHWHWMEEETQTSTSFTICLPGYLVKRIQ